MGVVIGWLAVLLGIFALAPSIVPGAMSVMGLLVSFVALVMAVLTVRSAGQTFFKVTLGLVIVGVLLVNDGTRLWGALMPLDIRLPLYVAAFIVCLLCVIAVHSLVADKKQS